MCTYLGEIPRGGAEDLRGADDGAAEGLQRAPRPQQQEGLRPSLPLRFHAGNIELEWSFGSGSTISLRIRATIS